MTKEPYRLFFPLGTLLLLCGALVWVPLIWNPGEYPVTLHRFLMLNGFTGCFIGGFLMTAVPKFSQTWPAKRWEVYLYLFITLAGTVVAHLELEKWMYLLSAAQPAMLLAFLLGRISHRKMNPPYSFVFIFVGLILWIVSGVLSAFVDPETFKQLHYEGAIACIILGVGGRLIPGILGHVEIVMSQRNAYEKQIAIIKTVPLHFLILIVSFAGSYFMSDFLGTWVRAVVVTLIGIFYWKLYSLPKDKTVLTRCLWFSSWMIVLSFILKALWIDGVIHASHSFFINGIVLLSFLIATRVLQSHGPQDKRLEDKKILYFVTGLIFIAALTRITAFIMPDLYLKHLAYSAIMLVIGATVWGLRYLKYALRVP